MLNWRPESLSISASAGFGKTERLAVQIIALICADPKSLSSILAMTFTKAAAGEIYDRILTMLSKAAGDEKNFSALKERLARDAGFVESETIAREDLVSLLRELVFSMNRIRIGTLDSFMSQAVQAFPFELGLPGGAVMIAPEEEKNNTLEILRQVLNGSADSESIMHACRDMVFGNETKSLYSLCSDLIGSLKGYRRFSVLPAVWNYPVRVSASQAVLDSAYAACVAEITAGDKDLSGLFHVLEICRSCTPETKFSREDLKQLREFFKASSEIIGPLPGFKKGVVYGGDSPANLSILLTHAAQVLTAQAAFRTGALRVFLIEYLKYYRKNVLDKGRMTFEDLPVLLDFSASPDDFSGWKQEIGYRLNSSIKHSLIDEFQDTSRGQWNFLREIVSDRGDGDQSLFIVGDVKQAIYGWRGGDSRLMGEVSESLQIVPLEQSFRYGPEICEALNFIFGENLKNCEGIPASVRERWSGGGLGWTPHRASEKTKTGVFTVTAAIQIDPSSDFTKLAAKVICAKLKKLDLFKNKLKCGILVRRGADGLNLKKAIAELEPELAGKLIWEGDESISQDPLIGGLLAFLIWLQHPGDTLAREVVRLTPPLAGLLALDREKMLFSLMERGPSEFLELCVRKAVRLYPDYDSAANQNLPILLKAADDWNAVNTRFDAVDFRDFAWGRKKRAAALDGKVRVMTIHHSKGLSFDVVFVPMFSAVPFNYKSPDYQDFVEAPDQSWLIWKPGAEGRMDPAIRAAAEARHADRSFEDLCSLYVALTRAKRETQVILPQVNKNKMKCYLNKRGGRRSIAASDESFYASDFLFETFFGDEAAYPSDALPTILYGDSECLERTIGNSRWCDSLTPPPAKPSVSPLFLEESYHWSALVPEKKTPSRLPVSGFHFHSGPEKLRGIAVHDFFEKIGQISEFIPPDSAQPFVLEHFARCKQNSEVFRILDFSGEIWNERDFDVLDRASGRFLSGRFDRVHIVRNPDGVITRAAVIDFKTDAFDLSSLSERIDFHAQQMRTYRFALSRLLNLPESEIELCLIFTQYGIAAYVNEK